MNHRRRIIGIESGANRIILHQIFLKAILVASNPNWRMEKKNMNNYSHKYGNIFNSMQFQNKKLH